MATIRKEPPVAPLLGYFDAQGMDMEDGLPSTWLVLRWQGVQNMLDFTRTYREKEKSQQPRFRWFLKEEKMEDTQVARYLKQTFRGSISAVQFCHDQGVAHCALDGSSFLLSSLDVRSANTLRTTISNFGFSRIRAGCSEEEWREAKRLDMEALGFTLAELILSSLSLEEKDVQATRSELERVYLEVFQRDFKSMKEYCQLEEKWEKAIELLDAREEAGWKVLGGLLSGVEPPTVLLESTFLQG